MDERNEILKPEDMMQIMKGLSYGTACRTIREVRAYSDRLGIRGCIHRRDWEDYLNRFNKKAANETFDRALATKNKSAY